METKLIDQRISLRSEEVQDILSYVPHWIIRWGITAIFLTVLALLVVTWIIKFPEIIPARITVTTENPPVRMVARAEGKLQIFVKENDPVTAGTYLAAIENPARVQDVLILKRQLEGFQQMLAEPESLQAGPFNEAVVLGELQDGYSTFLKSCLAYRFFIETDFEAGKIQSLRAQIKLYGDLSQKLAHQQEIVAEEAALARQKYENARTLFDKKLISQVELANARSVHLEKIFALKNAESNMINNDIQAAEQQKAILDLQQAFQERSKTLVLAMREAYTNLQSRLAWWEQQYILKAPVDGRISFFKFWRDNQVAGTGEEVMTVIPDSHHLLGKIFLAAARSGKVQVGQAVKIKFDNYPYAEFGLLSGEIAAMAPVARDNRYAIDVRLPQVLTTSYGKTLEFKQEMQGQADIITEDLRLLDRIFNRFRAVFSR